MSTTNKDEQKRIVEIAIDELKRTLDWLDGAYDHLKTKNLTFLGAGLGILTFLYASGDTFIPKDTAGQVFYFAGLGLMVAALSILVMALLPRRWEFSVEIPDLKAIKFPSRKDFLDSEFAFLEYILGRYLTAYGVNIKSYEGKHKLVDLAFFPLIIGAIILVVLKIFGA